MNIYDIAREAGVSISTVSRVINNNSIVARTTRKKVAVVLEKYSYRPNSLARGLVMKTSNTIGVLTFDVREPQSANGIYIIEQECEKYDYTVFLCNTGENTRTQMRYMQILGEKQIDGIIVVRSVFGDTVIENELRRFSQKKPVMMVNGVLSGNNLYSVISDNSYGIQQVVEHLIRGGRRNIWYVRDSATDSAFRKVNGFKTGILRAGLPWGEDRVIHTERGLDGGKRAVDAILSRAPGCDAIITGEDITALGVVKGLKAKGLRIPEDVAVSGYNNTIFSQCSEPELTTVDTALKSRLSLAVHFLKDAISGKEVPSESTITPTLVVREST